MSPLPLSAPCHEFKAIGPTNHGAANRHLFSSKVDYLRYFVTVMGRYYIHVAFQKWPCDRKLPMIKQGDVEGREVGVAIKGNVTDP